MSSNSIEIVEIDELKDLSVDTEEFILLRPQKVADCLGVKPNTLKQWRSQGRGPDYVKFGGQEGRVRYRLSSLRAFIESQEVSP